MISLDKKNKIKKDILGKFRDVFNKKNVDSLKKRRKEDNTIVTEIDIFISNIIKSELSDLSEFCFFSEEDYETLSFPSIILDPIDGTKELVQGYPECCLSLAIMEENNLDKGWGWIFNPFTGFEISTDDDFFGALNFNKDPLVGFVSRSEWSKGLFNKEKERTSMSLIPRGSIAYKLGLLASGACDFVVTKKPKNIWDVAAGSILCQKRGFNFYQNGIEISSFSETRLEGPLYWCRKENSLRIQEYFNFQ
jgi:myo-inositol-1(or 4)-monophosphatase